MGELMDSRGYRLGVSFHLGSILGRNILSHGLPNARVNAED